MKRTLEKPRTRLRSVTFAGHGHYRVVVEKRGRLYAGVTSNMSLIDQYKNGSAMAADKLAIMAGKGIEI